MKKSVIKKKEVEVFKTKDDLHMKETRQKIQTSKMSLRNTSDNDVFVYFCVMLCIHLLFFIVILFCSVKIQTTHLVFSFSLLSPYTQVHHGTHIS